MSIFHTTVSIYKLAISPEQPSGSEKTFDPYRTTSVDPASAYSNLSTKPKASTIREAGATIMKHSSTIHMTKKDIRS
jgi:hypothetical protein